MQRILLEQFIGQDMNNYHLEQLLSNGQASAVYQAHQQKSQQLVTLILLALPENMSAQQRRRFSARILRIAPTLVEIRHPHLFPFYDYGEWQSFFYLVTPLFPPQSLAALLSQQGPCDPATALTLLEQIAAALEYAHCRGLVHGALGLSNLFMSNNQQIQIAGLGVQQLLERRDILPVAQPDEQVLTLADNLFEAYRYLAPECRLQGQAATIRSDIYSLGMVLCELLTGISLSQEMAAVAAQNQPLLPGQILEEAHLAKSVEHVLRQALAKEPARRFQRVSDFLGAFARAVEEQGTPATIDCTHCPLLSGMQVTENPMQSQGLTDLPQQPGSELHTATSLEMDSQAVRSRVVREQTGGEALTRSRTRSRRGRAYMFRSHKLSRRQLIDLSVKGTVFGALGASMLSAGYLLTTALRKPPTPQVSGLRLPQPPINSAITFTNPSDGQQGLLIHLPNGKFVAYERACTHIYVPVNYNSQNHLLVCPAHLAVFDPAQGAQVLKGPAKRPLPRIPVQTNSDGTVIVGGDAPAHTD